MTGYAELAPVTATAAEADGTATAAPPSFR
jgi:hypothetical protein